MHVRMSNSASCICGWTSSIQVLKGFVSDENNLISLLVAIA